MAYLRWSFSDWYVFASDGGLSVWSRHADGTADLPVYTDAEVEDFLVGRRTLDEIPGWNNTASDKERDRLVLVMREYLMEERYSDSNIDPETGQINIPRLIRGGKRFRLIPDGDDRRVSHDRRQNIGQAVKYEGCRRARDRGRRKNDIGTVRPRGCHYPVEGGECRAHSVVTIGGNWYCREHEGPAADLYEEHQGRPS